MKKLFFTIMAMSILCACQKEAEYIPEDVTFTIDYTLDKGVNMTRSGADLYNDFYNNFVKTKKVGYPKYELKFYQNDKLVGTFEGEWDATLVTLPEGTYTVEGKSKSSATGVYQSGGNEHLSKMSLDFSEEVVISKGQTTITLNPTYDCYLLFLDASLFSRGIIYGPDSYGNESNCRFFEAGSVLYTFINSASKVTKIGYVGKDGDEGTLNIDTMGFEVGKYYCLDAVATGYQLPPMDSGF